MEQFVAINKAVNGFVWGPVMLALLVGTGVYLSVAVGFIQFSKIGYWWKNTIGKIFKKGEAGDGEITPLQAVSTALASTVGTGNIAGVTGAIVLGGPGAVFWMWLSALFGMVTKFSEVTLAVKYRERNEKGDWCGGPMYYIKNGLGPKWKWLGGVFAVLGAIAAFGIGNIAQVHSIADSVKSVAIAFNENAASKETMICLITGICVAAFVALVLLGGVKRIGQVTEKLVPIMAVLYLVGGLILLILRLPYLPETIGMIFKYAFFPNAIIGGSLGYALKMAVSQGVKRGLFSNEAGMGSTPHAHAMAKVKHPHEQGVVAMTGVFIDTFVVLTMTALVVISTLYAGNGILSAGAAEGVSKANMAQLAFGTVLGSRAGSMFVAVCLLFFAFSTILSWNFFGRLNVSWLLGEKAVGVYSVLAIGFIFLGSCLSNDLVWELADLFNQLMVLPNVLALVTLGGLVAAACRRK